MTALDEAREELATNPRQWDAFTSVGHCVVLAPPGSGKTKLLTTRLADDLRRRIRRPHGAACITLTNAAADELRHRLDALGVDERSTLFVGTVHSFALSRIVVPFAGAAGKPELLTVQVVSDQEADDVLKEAIGEFYEEGEDRYVDSTVRRLRRMMDESAIERAGGRLAEVCARVEELLRERGLIDFEGIVSEAVNLVERHRFIRRALVARYPVIYVDEYQDLAPGLDRLVRALCFDHDTRADLFAVGDPYQSIYGWTGSRPELMKELSQRPGMKTVELDLNYRSGEEIIRVSSLALGEEREVRGTRGGGVVDAHHEPDGYEAQLEGAVSLITNAVQAGVPCDEIAVLCQSNAECVEAAEAFRNANLPVFVRENDEYRQTRATLLIEALAAWSTLPPGQSGHRLAELLSRWRAFVPDVDVDLVRLLREGRGLANRPAADFLERLNHLGLSKALASKSRADDAVEVARMYRSLKSGQLRQLTLGQLAERARALGRVYVTTMTASKGLEFDIVIILGVEQGKLPFFRSLGDESALAEDRRKFYVSLTRARHAVHVFYSGWFRWRSGYLNSDGPSQFLTELGLA